MREGISNPRRGFTLVEVMVAVGLSGFILAGVLATNVHLIRSGLRITHYAEMESQVRRGLDQLGEDIRNASAVRWNSPSDITLAVPTGSGPTAEVTYAWSAEREAFFMVPGPTSAASTGRIYLIEGLPRGSDGRPGVAFARFDRDGLAATSDGTTKRIQVTLHVRRQARTMAETQSAVAATFTMRNKRLE